MASASTEDSTTLFQQIDEYPWSTDQEFQGGLRAILGSVQDPAQVTHLTMRARCYYFARKFDRPVDFDGYKAWCEAQQEHNNNGSSRAAELGPNGDASSFATGISSAPTAVEDGGLGGIVDAPKPASFAEICDMIAEGKPIPGIKEIPDTILEGQASESHASQRRKPWESNREAAVAAEQTPSWMTTT